MSAPAISVVVATYEWPEALRVTLRALADLPDRDFDVVVADDGSGPATQAVVQAAREGLGTRLRFVGQANDGFRKARLLNLAALHTRGDFLVFMDGDCLPRRGFLRAVRRAALPGWFLSGKRVRLGRALSQRVLDEDLELWRWSAARLLVTAPRDVLRPGLVLPLRDRRRPWRHKQQEFSPPYDSYGFFCGVSRSDFEEVNGFDTRFVGWGAEDVDLAVRLRQSGLRCGWPGPESTLLHLWHEKRTRRSSSNKLLLRETRSSKRVEAIEGLRELELDAA